MNYTPDIKITKLGGEFYDPVKPVEFPDHILRWRDDRAAASIGLDHLSDADWISYFGQFEPLPDNLSEPLALRYHGHQFRHYNPDIGDGRGFLYAQLRDAQDRLMDLGTKGSGQTPYSRSGDGRLTLLGGVREVLATRYLESLGVNTSKSLSLIETGESLTRHDEPSPTRSAVLTRLSHSHIRFGTFQRLFFHDDAGNMQKLTDYALRHYFSKADATPAALLQASALASADMVASWMAAGFVHGVMNTDNMNITGESFDYGPYRFLPTMQADFTAAYFDHGKLYAFARQPENMYWNLAQLANCLSLISDDEPLLEALKTFEPAYQAALIHHMFRRLGVAPSGEAQRDLTFVFKTFDMLEKSQASFPQFFHDWHGGAGAEPRTRQSINGDVYSSSDFSDWLKIFSSYESVSEPKDTALVPALLYDQIQALWAPIAEHDDWSKFDLKIVSFDA